MSPVLVTNTSFAALGASGWAWPPSRRLLSSSSVMSANVVPFPFALMVVRRYHQVEPAIRRWKANPRGGSGGYRCGFETQLFQWRSVPGETDQEGPVPRRGPLLVGISAQAPWPGPRPNRREASGGVSHHPRQGGMSNMPGLLSWGVRGRCNFPGWVAQVLASSWRPLRSAPPEAVPTVALSQHWAHRCCLVNRMASKITTPFAHPASVAVFSEIEMSTTP
jgi:hypothetical protein